MGLRQEHEGHRIEPDEGSSGFYLAFCVPCRRVVGDYDQDGALVYDDDEREAPAPRSRHYVINEDGSLGGIADD